MVTAIAAGVTPSGSCRVTVAEPPASGMSSAAGMGAASGVTNQSW